MTKDSAVAEAQEQEQEQVFLHGIGQKVRDLRAERGLSRKALAEASGLSERYIAQLEAGKGNVSVILLRRVCAATGAQIEDMFPAPAGAPRDWAAWRKLISRAAPEQITRARAALATDSGAAPGKGIDRIALVGLRGAGKSTLGKMLAVQLGCPFVELNREIERDRGLSVNEIHALYGQDGYRRLEQASLRALTQRPGAMVLATNGGLVGEPLSYDLVLDSFFTIWIKARPDEHMARVQKQGNLRLANEDPAAMQELRATLASRNEAYARASAVVDTSGEAVATSLADMLALLRRARGETAQRVAARLEQTV